ncbi:hypothetical protein [Streptomyces sp. CAU 1734]|uniref:hypothetical protein n=1 Tax=Streptomyces sp. CAU 1734 TaxID=3140360 RepID=UPI003260B0D4
MLTDLIRQIRAWLPAQMQTMEYSCGRCGLKAEITDHPDNARRLLDAVLSHGCKPSPRGKTL